MSTLASKIIQAFGATLAAGVEAAAASGGSAQPKGKKRKISCTPCEAYARVDKAKAQVTAIRAGIKSNGKLV